MYQFEKQCILTITLTGRGNSICCLQERKPKDCCKRENTATPVHGAITVVLPGTAHKKIAQACGNLDSEKAYVLGLLHDIGRKFGIRHLGHVSDGYSYMMSLGYEEAARVCLTHSFPNQKLEDYVGKYDTTKEELTLIQNTLQKISFDEYDRLIQLCDALAGSEGVLDIEIRMADVRRRYGFYPEEKWKRNLALKKYFEEKIERNIYDVVKISGQK